MNPVVSLTLQQTLASTLLNKKLDTALSVHGVSYTEFVIMHHLNSAPEGSRSRIALAELVGLTASGITRLLAPMEKNHVVLKIANPRDARQSLVGLTETGKRLYSEANQTAQTCCQSAFAHFEAQELEQLQTLIGKIRL